MDKTKESLSIRLLDSHSNPLKNQEFRLFEVQNGRRSIINTIFTSNENGEAFFNVKEVFKEGTQSFEIGLHNTLCYKRKPIYNHRYLLRNYEYGYLCEVKFAKKADDASIEKVTLKPKEYLLDNNEKIILKFYAGGDIVELEAFYDVTKIQEDEIKWGYTLLTASSQEHSKNLDTLNKNQLTNDKKDSSLFDDKISTTCCHIEKRGDIAILSGTPIDMMQDNPQAYRGKTIQIALPKTTNQQAILIFAYKNTPNYRASQLIRLNDYPQITIDCTLAETLRAYTRQDNIATLGFGVSYVCQRLWHDNPSDAKELSKLIYIDSHSPDFIESIPNATMQSIVKEVLPRITLKEFSKDSNNKCPAIKSQIQEIKDKNLRFYVELDWDRFYMQFPLMKGLEDKILRVPAFENDINQFVKDSIKEMTYETFEYIRKTTETPKILHNNFFDSAFYEKIIEWLKSDSIQKALQDIVSSKNTNAKLIVMFDNIYQGFTENEKIFSLKGNDWESDNICKKQSLVDIKKPYKLWGQCMRAYGLGDTAFVSIFDFKEAVALYALTGKFNIYYIPSLFKITQGKDNAIDIQITEIKAYIFDGFDFIGTSGQFVGAWNYEKMEFKVFNSTRKMFREVTGSTKVISIGNVKEANENIMFNQDYQNTQKYFNLGLDFRIVTPTFKSIKVYPLSMPIQIKLN
ncbi:hypothetical protein HPMG_00030 [Helicobacter pullorum MIT 98-5489]|uniref:Uncharacterized protein n=1 Tax=Helicobacter pullorum MIT 98-5489 TaxID=537972 RepID=C5EX29_9HELI|nr:hypothetical protein [Helicobacter pullorum]EEQ62573.1 hypothetical protein HPMG_00030 [Helicobacter pullorum MIT 98-5489]